jgi:hypothetical protein
MTHHSCLSSLVATAMAVGATVASAQQPGDNPGQPDPTDRGGEFVIVGCLTRPSPQPSGGPLFVVTDVTSEPGDTRMIGAMGAGVPTGRGRESARGARPTDPPDIVDAQYRVVADDADIDLAAHVNRKVRMRGTLMADRESTPAAGRPANTFMAGEVEKVNDTCS